jgi:hypothetical protein
MELKVKKNYRIRADINSELEAFVKLMNADKNIEKQLTETHIVESALTFFMNSIMKTLNKNKPGNEKGSKKETDTIKSYGL